MDESIDAKVMSMTDMEAYGPEFVAWWNGMKLSDRAMIIRQPARLLETYRRINQGAIRFWLTGELS